MASSDNVMYIPDLPADAWTEDRMIELGAAMQAWLRQYTDAAVQFTSALLTAVTRFVTQVGVVGNTREPLKQRGRDGGGRGWPTSGLLFRHSNFTS